MSATPVHSVEILARRAGYRAATGWRPVLVGYARSAAGAGGVEQEFPTVWPQGQRDRRLHRVGRRLPAKGLRVEEARLLRPHYAPEAEEQPPSDVKRLGQTWNPPGTSRFQGRREERRR